MRNIILILYSNFLVILKDTITLTKIRFDVKAKYKLRMQTCEKYFVISKKNRLLLHRPSPYEYITLRKKDYLYNLLISVQDKLSLSEVHVISYNFIAPMKMFK